MSYSLIIYRNRNSSDNELQYTSEETMRTFQEVYDTSVSAGGSHLFTKAGYHYLKFNTARDGSGTDYFGGETLEADLTVYVIWESDLYVAQGADLAAVADAIRAKAGSSAAMAFPSGFVSAVEGIELGLDYTDGQFTSGSISKSFTGSTTVAQDELIGTWTYSTSPANKIAISPDIENTVVQSKWQQTGYNGSWGNASSYYVVFNTETVNGITVLKSVSFYAAAATTYNKGTLSLRANIQARVITVS